MSRRKVLSTSVLSLCVIAAAGAPGTAFAKPDKPINAAESISGTGCWVRDAAGTYHPDANCKWHVVVRRNQDGTYAQYSYRDQGHLPENAPRPSTPSKNSEPWPDCLGGLQEMTMPNGEYWSACRLILR